MPPLAFRDLYHQKTISERAVHAVWKMTEASTEVDVAEEAMGEVTAAAEMNTAVEVPVQTQRWQQ